MVTKNTMQYLNPKSHVPDPNMLTTMSYKKPILNYKLIVYQKYKYNVSHIEELNLYRNKVFPGTFHREHLSL